MNKQIVFALLCISRLYSSEGESPIDIFAIPGQNGQGAAPSYIKVIFLAGREDLHKRMNVTPIPTPRIFPDFGQSVCMQPLKEACDAYKGDTLIMYGASQGTATALNYAAQDKSNKIKALILEAVLASGNSAIFQTVTGPLMDMRRLGRMPGAYFMIPYLAKTLFPRYSPSGAQPIRSIEKIPQDMPIILIHSKEDMQLPYAGACAVYYRLRELGNNNTYFITKPFDHINILEYKDYRVIRSILEKHGVIDKKDGVPEVDLSPYQPDPAQFKESYDAFIKKEKKHGRWHHS